MIAIFRYDNKFWKAISKLVDLVLVSILGFIGCLPILTIGRSINAMMHTFQDIDQNNNSSVIKSFFKHYIIKRWFIWPTVSVLLMFSNLFAALFILWNLDQGLNFVFFMALFMYIYLLITNIYIFLILTYGNFEKHLLIKLIFYIALKNFSYTVLLALLNGIFLLLLVYIMPYLFPVMIGMTLWINYKMVHHLILVNEYDELLSTLQ